MSKVKRYFLILPILCIALIPCTSIFASAGSYSLEYDISEPCSSELTGYIVIPYLNTSGDKFDTVYFWVITPTISDDTTLPLVSWNFSNSSNSFSLTFSTNQTGHSYFVSLYSTTTGGTITHQHSDNVTYNHAYTYSRSYNSSYTILRPQLKNVSVIGDWPTSDITYDVLWSGDSKLYNELINVHNRLILLINSLDLTNEQLEQTYSLLSTYFKKYDTSLSNIDFYITELADTIFWWQYQVDEDHARIIELLEALVNGTEDFTESSTLSPEQDELNRVEDELLNNEEASNAQDDIKVEVNQDAMSVIWDLISDFFQTNPKIMGMVITILSLGIIALILNR